MRRRLLLAALVAVGCGDNVPGLPYEDLATARREAECGRLVRCGVFSDIEACAEQVRVRVDVNLDAAVANGSVRYQAVSTTRCLDALANASCDLTEREARTEPDVCHAVLVGTLNDGASCAIDEQCASGWCDAPTCSPDTCCPGACRSTPFAERGQTCADDRECRGDDVCGTDGTCAARAQAGAACREDDECIDGLACVGATELQAGACRPLPAIGETCPYMRCAELGAFCDAAQTCTAVKQSGEACSTDVECSAFRRCDPATRTCTTPPALGMPCSGPCRGAAWCELTTGTEGTCVVPRPDGEPCGAGDQCESTFCKEGPLFAACAPLAICS